jgi:hypothetical protein
VSTILDALKKSEQERKQSAVPVLASAQAPEEKKPVWFWLLLFIILVAVVGGLLWLTTANIGNRNSVSPVTAAATQTQSSVNLPKPVELSQAPERLAVDANSGQVPSVDVISYSDDPARRFVIIQGKTLREGDFIGAGVKVEKIMNNVVVLNIRGDSMIVRP